MNVNRRFFTFGKEPGGFDDDVHPRISPRNTRRVTFAIDDDGLAIDAKLSVGRLHGHRQGAQQRVIFQQVGQRFAVSQIVDCHNLNIRIAQRRAQDVTPDSAETINTDLNHDQLLICCLWWYFRFPAFRRK